MRFESIENILTDEFVRKVSEFEGFSLRPYRCPAGVLTIGYGHTRSVKKTDRVTSSQALDLLRDDLVECYYDLRNVYDISLWTIGMKQCFIDFVFNCGIGTLKKSSMHSYLLGFSKLEPSSCAQSLLVISSILERYVYAGNKRLFGLVRRRSFEVSLLNVHL